MRTFFTLTLAYFLCFNCTAAGVTPAVVPKNLHIYNVQGSTYVDIVAHDCSGSRYHLNPNHPKYDAIFSMLLSAQLAERKVMVKFDDCINGSNPQGEIIGVYLP
ncbi:hypothetical protein [Shewanella sp. NKUCC06_TVS]|uniref:hypothetical protein n=1 Tax=Shewanella sp. NKUCC06_TVS TaxID=2842128 RepID=UPI001C5AE870|nr:hypothetical protein [Shewanella sp. NKUCC06_TVS]MBW3533000.1 hypothetical protein [Shewanella sp. NKUCC06_TVS]